MAYSYNYATRVITIPQTDLVFVSGTLYTLDMNTFKNTLADEQDSATGVAFEDMISHNSEVLLSGVTYVRTVEVINGYTVEFEDGQYTVSLNNGNHNLADVRVANQVSLIVNNSAGNTVVSGGGSGATPQEVWEYNDRTLTSTPAPTADENADTLLNKLI